MLWGVWELSHGKKGSYLPNDMCHYLSNIDKVFDVVPSSWHRGQLCLAGPRMHALVPVPSNYSRNVPSHGLLCLGCFRI